MEKIFLFLIVSFLSFFYPTYLSYSQNQGLSRVITSQYLHTAEFNTVSGILKINLPSDMGVSEQVSGSVSFDRYKLGEVNSASLSDYSLVVENQKVKLSGNMFTVILPPNLPTGVLNVLVKDSKGKDVGRAFYPVRIRATTNQTKKGNPSDFKMPLSARTGLPTEIQGPFDGNYSNSVISVDGKRIPVIAESPRKLVFISPQTAKGARLLALNEAGVVVKSPFTNLHVVRVGRDDLLAYESDNSEVIRNYETNEFLIERDNADKKAPSGEKEILISSKKQKNKDVQPTLNQPIQNKPVELGPSIEDISQPLKLDPGEIKQIDKISTTKSKPKLKEKELIADSFPKEEKSTKKPEKNLDNVKKEVEIAKTVEKKEGPKDIAVIEKYMESQFNASFVKYEDDKPKQSEPDKPVDKKVAVKKNDQLKEYKINDLNSLNLENKKFEQQITLAPTKKEAPEKKKVAKIQTTPKAKSKVQKNSKTFAIQLASFKKRSDAEILVNKLNSKGLNAYLKRSNVPGKGYWNRVRIGGFETRSEAEKYKKNLVFKDLHIKSFFVTLED